jgi:hypothetical protein
MYGLAVTGIGDARHLMRNDASRPGMPISGLTRRVDAHSRIVRDVATAKHPAT